MPRLRRSDCAAPGITRRGRGRGFEYLDPDGQRIDDPETLERIAELAVPPAWRDVWICLDPLGHLQATGIDDAGRKQYRYHDQWRARRDREKFGSMVEFGHALPKLRRRVRRDLRRDALDRARVLACATRLLDLGFFRIGSEDYAVHQRDLRPGHDAATPRHGRGRTRSCSTTPPSPASGASRPSRTRTCGRSWRRSSAAGAAGPSCSPTRTVAAGPTCAPTTSTRYVKDATSHDFSAKDFRTWNATVLAAVALAGGDGKPRSKTAYKRAAAEAVKTVAAYLGNTPAVARASYIDPRVFDRFRSGWTIAETLRDVGEPDLGDPRKRARIEAAVLELLEGE